MVTSIIAFPRMRPTHRNFWNNARRLRFKHRGHNFLSLHTIGSGTKIEARYDIFAMDTIFSFSLRGSKRDGGTLHGPSFVLRHLSSDFNSP